VWPHENFISANSPHLADSILDSLLQKRAQVSPREQRFLICHANVPSIAPASPTELTRGTHANGNLHQRQPAGPAP
jgi:hypothetical protein